MFPTQALLSGVFSALALSMPVVLAAKTSTGQAAGKQVAVTGRIKVDTNQYLQAQGLIQQGFIDNEAVIVYLIAEKRFNYRDATLFTLTADGRLTAPNKEAKPSSDPQAIPPGQALFANVVKGVDQPEIAFNTANQMTTNDSGKVSCTRSAQNELKCLNEDSQEYVKFATCPISAGPKRFVFLPEGADAKNLSCKVYTAIFEIDEKK